MSRWKQMRKRWMQRMPHAGIDWLSVPPVSYRESILASQN